MIALTATATPRVKDDIIISLGLDPRSVSEGGTTKFFSTTTARPNLHYEVRYFSESSPHHSSGDDLFPNLLSWLTAISSLLTVIACKLTPRLRQLPPRPRNTR